MKKFLALLFTCILTGSLLAGCGGKTTTTGNEGNSGQEGGKIKIGLTMSSRDQFLSTLETAVKDAAKDYSDVEIVAFDAENDIQKQLSHISSFVSQDCGAIIVNLVNTDTSEEILKAAGDVPVVFVNRLPNEKILEDSSNASYVGSDEYEAGQLQAKFLTDYFKDKSDKTINYVLFMGTLGLQHTNARSKAVKATLEENGFTLVKQFEDTAEFDRAKAMAKMQQFIGTGKPFDVVIGNNDEMALGAVEALKSANKLDVPVVGIDATANAIAAIEAEEMACSVFQDASGQGAGAFDFAYKMAKGEEVDKYGWIPFQVVSLDNIEDFK
ncbi:rhizopine-binding protein [Vallitalea longa]|uniref:Rhizopine-binding protein n=1 Tax=Vallitalea longa TaxID=2936439 RepID=A0A9W6DG28_9FIRM|nr:substrate-binding domain-containing protein [Vallitalea longa]GKX29314.1 rhizopine-binding protein [Vallitalea longa]